MAAYFPAEVLVLTVTNTVTHLRSLLKDHPDLFSSVVKYRYGVIALGNHFECGAGMQCVILTASQSQGREFVFNVSTEKENINVFV